MKFGAAQIRDEDARLVSGAGRYAGDRVAEGALWMHVVRADVAAGRIVEIETAAALAMPGVHRVLTGADPEVLAMQGFALRYRPEATEPVLHPVRPLAQGAVHYAGEPLAVVVADTRHQAQDAAEALMIDIDFAEAVTDARKAAAPEAPQVWPEGNTIFTQELGDRAAFDAALAEAAHVVRAEIEISCVTAVTLEPRGALAVPEGETVTLYTGTQATHRVRAEITHVLDWPEDALRVVAEDVGGSFGMRNGAYPEDVLAVHVARATGRPVRWRADRVDGFLSDTQSRPQSLQVTLALDADHRFLALGLDGFAPVGAYTGPMSLHPMTSSLPALAGVYRTPVLHTVMRGMAVNRMHMAPYRGAGRPEAIFAVERIIDIAAHRLGLDRIALRRRNMIEPAQMPYATPLGFLYDSGDFPRVLDTALAAADWQGFAARRRESEARGRLRGVGLACAIESAGSRSADVGMPEYAALEVAPGAGLTVSAGSGDCGQGHGRAFAHMAERFLGWQGAVRVVSGDTAAVPKGLGTFGSRTMGAMGQAMSDAAAELIARALPVAAQMLDVAPEALRFEDGAFRIAGSNRFLTLEDLCTRSGRSFRAEAWTSAKAGTFPNGVHIAEVEIDPETGALDLLRYTVADDVGTVVDPVGLAGQLHGGIAQGLGQALMERIVYDDDGALLTGSFMDYALPRAADLPFMTLDHAPTPTEANALGAKGAGESGTVGALAAGISAVHDALRPLGVEDVTMPATPCAIWQAIQTAQTKGEPT
jgi:carbon-monoxide dehydrogenase large subunit